MWNRTGQLNGGHAPFGPYRFRRPRGLITLVIALLMAACGSPESGEFSIADPGESGGQQYDDFSPNLDQSQSNLIMGSENWDLLMSFDHSVGHNFRVSARYGRSVAQVNAMCSGFLVSDDLLVTANHCGRFNRIAVDFGMYGVSSNDHRVAIHEARERLEALGVPSREAAQFANNSAPHWSCTRIGQDSDRDVDYYRCPPQTITWTQPGLTGGNRTVRFDVRPGQIWGHYYAATDPFRHMDGRTRMIQTGSVNRMCNDPNFTVLLGIGAIGDESDWCTSLDYSNCFHHTGDHVGGSSGGVVYDVGFGSAIGVIGGSQQGWFGDSDDPCESWWTGGPSTNIASYMSNTVRTHVGAGQSTPTLTMGAHTEQAKPWIGGRANPLESFDCPAGFLAAGLIGTENREGLSNLGVICLPFTSSPGIGLDRAVVLSAGAADNGFRRVNQMLFGRYINEVESSGQVQDFQMCPAGYFIKGVSAHANDTIGSLEAMFCEKPRSGHRVFVGLSWGGQYRGMQGAYTECGNHNFMSGIDVRADEKTDGLGLRCRGIPQNIPKLGQSITLSGELVRTSPSFVRANDRCQDSNSPAFNHYGQWAFMNNTGVLQRLRITADWSGNGHLFVYRNAFDPTDETQNCLAVNDNFESVDRSRINSIAIQPGETLYIVATTTVAMDIINDYELTVLTKEVEQRAIAPRRPRVYRRAGRRFP